MPQVFGKIPRQFFFNPAVRHVFHAQYWLVLKTHSSKTAGGSEKSFKFWDDEEICHNNKWFWRKFKFKSGQKICLFQNFQNFEAAFRGSMSAQDDKILHAELRGGGGESAAALKILRDIIYLDPAVS